MNSEDGENEYDNKAIVDTLLEYPQLLRRTAPFVDPDGAYNKDAKSQLLAEITCNAAHAIFAAKRDAERDADNEALLKKFKDLEAENLMLMSKDAAKFNHIVTAMARELAMSDDLNASYRRELQLTGELYQPRT